MSSSNAYVDNPNNKENEISTTLFVAVNTVSSLAILLEPFIPFSSEKIWSQAMNGGFLSIKKTAMEKCIKFKHKARSYHSRNKTYFPEN